MSQEILRLSAEQLYKNEIDALIANETDPIPKGWQKENQVKTIADLEVAVNAYFQQEFVDYNVEHPDAPMTEARTADLTGDDAVDANLVLVRWQPANETAFGNVPAVTGACACYYIGLKELERAGNTPYMNFKQVPGQAQNQRIYYKEQGRLFNLNKNTSSSDLIIVFNSSG